MSERRFRKTTFAVPLILLLFAATQRPSRRTMQNNDRTKLDMVF